MSVSFGKVVVRIPEDNRKIIRSAGARNEKIVRKDIDTKTGLLHPIDFFTWQGIVLSRVGKVDVNQLPESLDEKKELIVNIIKKHRPEYIHFLAIDNETSRNDVISNGDFYNSQFVQSVKTDKQAELVINALTKNHHGKFIYSVADAFKFLRVCQDEEMIDFVIETIKKSNSYINRSALGRYSDLKAQDVEKYNAVLSSKILTAYFNLKDSEYLAKATPQELIDVSRKATNLLREYNYPKGFDALVDLCFKENELVRKYVVRNRFSLGKFFSDEKMYKAGLDSICVDALKEVKKAYKAKTIDNELLQKYVFCSDTFKQHDQLGEYISQFKTQSPISVFRCEKNTNIFKDVSLKGTELEAQTRKLVCMNEYQAKNVDSVIPNEGTYRFDEERRLSLYDYIMDKEELSLADAMLVAKYGDDDFIDKIRYLIETTDISDDRFKSTSYSKAFVEKWKRNKESWATIISELNIKEGTEGVFVSSQNGQMEFLLNNTPKTFRYYDVDYDREQNTFFLKGVVENIKE